MDVEQIYDSIKGCIKTESADPKHTIRTTLLALTTQGRVVKVGRMYSLPSAVPPEIEASDQGILTQGASCDGPQTDLEPAPLETHERANVQA
jgi:hypothetical protein